MNELAPLGEVQKIIEALDRRFPDLRCLRCGDNRLAVLDEPDHGRQPGIAVANRASDGSARSHGIIPTITMACMNCGHIEQFLETFLKKSVDGAR